MSQLDRRYVLPGEAGNCPNPGESRAANPQGVLQALGDPSCYPQHKHSGASHCLLLSSRHCWLQLTTASVLEITDTRSDPAPACAITPNILSLSSLDQEHLLAHNFVYFEAHSCNCSYI